MEESDSGIFNVISQHLTHHGFG